MPNQITHFYFGQSAAAGLSDKAKEVILKYPGAYRVGSIGPDFMFVLREIGTGDAKRYANEMQYLRMYEVFKACSDYIRAYPSECLISYMLGLINHYVIDSRAHAYVNFFVEEIMPKNFPGNMHTSLHGLLEAALDEIVLTEYMCVDPRTYNIAKDIKPSKYEKEKIAELYTGAINGIVGFKVPKKTIKRAISLTIFFFRMLGDKHGRKKRFFNYLEDRRGSKKQMSSLIRPPYLLGEFDYMNRDHKKWRIVRNLPELTDESFDDLMEKCAETFKGYAAKFMDSLDGKALEPKDFRVNYEGVDVY
jgi:hypothetical protein